MMDVIFANTYWAPLLVLVISFILIYIALKKLNTGANDIVLAILSALFSIIIVSSTTSVRYVVHLIPYLSVLMIVSFTIILMLFFVAGKDMFNKYLAWTGFIIAIIMAVWLAFTYFPISHFLPNASNSGLGTNAINFKNWLYSNQIKDTIVLLVTVGIVGFFLTKK